MIKFNTVNVLPPNVPSSRKNEQQTPVQQVIKANLNNIKNDVVKLSK